MIIDTSALIAILFGEPEEETFLRILLRARGAAVSAATVLETQIVSRRRYKVASDKALDGLLYRMNLHIEPVTLDQFEAAREGYRRFGQGAGQGAGQGILNFGDCFSYALAKTSGRPLLFKGRDFVRTDVETVPWSPAS